MREEHIFLGQDDEGLVIVLGGNNRQRPNPALTREQVIAQLEADGWERAGTRDDGIAFKRFTMDEGM
jgi:hypothetical protein